MHLENGVQDFHMKFVSPPVETAANTVVDI